MSDFQWMIYGATGRSGQRIARKAVAQGLRPILAGRNEQGVRKIAEELNLAWRVFELGERSKFKREVSQVKLLVNAAGPLRQTSVLVAELCLATNTHYLDLSNQVPSLVAIYTLDAQAKEKNLTLLPGLAFSPAASNCLIQHLHTLLPGADALDIVLEPFMETHCTDAKLTFIESIAEDGFRRRGGVLERYWTGNGTEFALPNGIRRMHLAAVGDTEAAYRCTSIPNIETYVPADIGLFSNPNQTAREPALRSLLSRSGTKMGNRADQQMLPPKHSMVWARISKRGQSSVEGWLQCGEGHEFTTAVVIAGVSRLLGNEGSRGAHTPASAFGTDFILDLPNVERTVLSVEQRTGG